MKALILSANLGEGHNRCSVAIAQELKARDIDFVIEDSIDFIPSKLLKIGINKYNQMIKIAPDFYGIEYFAFTTIDKMKAPTITYKVIEKGAYLLLNYIYDNDIDFVISTHMFGMELVTALKRKFNYSIKSYAIMTDYTFIPFSKDIDVDIFFASCDVAKNETIESGNTNSKILISGIPVLSQFSTPLEKIETRHLLGIPTDKKMISILSGGIGVGGGSLISLIKSLYHKLDNDCCIYVFTGRNEKLKSSLDRINNNSGKLKVIPFTTDLYKYTKVSDLIISKPGGISSTEVAVSNIPLIHTKGIKGVEPHNVSYFKNHGLSVYGKNNSEVIKYTFKLLKDESLQKEMIENQSKYIRKDSTKFIVDSILETGDFNKGFNLKQL